MPKINNLDCDLCPKEVDGVTYMCIGCVTRSAKHARAEGRKDYKKRVARNERLKLVAVFDGYDGRFSADGVCYLILPAAVHLGKQAAAYRKKKREGTTTAQTFGTYLRQYAAAAADATEEDITEYHFDAAVASLG